MPWLPDGFNAPHHALVAGMRLTVLSTACANEDFAAVQASADAIRGVFGPDNDWPPATLTEQENRADLARHAQQFDDRSACAYALRDAGSAAYLGCMYLKPVKSRLALDARRAQFQAQGFVWLDVRRVGWSVDAVRRDLAAWVAQDWPFRSVAWPGYRPDWATWQALAKADGSGPSPGNSIPPP
jgi:hypothetical protein